MRAKSAACFLPWDELNRSSVDLLKTAVDFHGPGFFRAFVDGGIQAVDQWSDEGGAGFGWEGEGIAENFVRLTCHDSFYGAGPGIQPIG